MDLLKSKIKPMYFRYLAAVSGSAMGLFRMASVASDAMILVAAFGLYPMRRNAI